MMHCIPRYNPLGLIVVPPAGIEVTVEAGKVGAGYL